MWFKTEKNDRIVNLTEQSAIYVTEDQGKHIVAVPAGFGLTTIKSFKYKEDAEKYLDELLAQLNDEC